jgi:hypothetical protein
MMKTLAFKLEYMRSSIGGSSSSPGLNPRLAPYLSLILSVTPLKPAVGSQTVNKNYFKDWVIPQRTQTLPGNPFSDTMNPVFPVHVKTKPETKVRIMACTKVKARERGKSEMEIYFA